MKIPLSLLKEFLPITQTPEKLADVLTMAGLEVEDIKILGNDFNDVVVAKVISTEKHPNAEKLTIARVFDGTEELQIVCGAANCRPGLTTALAKIGATLTDEKGNIYTIKKGRLRDVDSYGMLCSTEELGLPFKEDGIIELESHLEAGRDLKGIVYDVIFDISLTPNLGHCQSVLGVARELAAFLKLPLKNPYDKMAKAFTTKLQPVKVKIEEPSAVINYQVAIAASLKVSASPSWLQQKLALMGLSSVNNVVDISNYIMHTQGQPLHMYDYDKIKDKELKIGYSKKEKALFLDGAVRAIDERTLAIYDSSTWQAAAGVMGAEESAISMTTKNVIIEAASFQPSAIRKSCKALNLKTDASSRFEKGIDPLLAEKALAYACWLLQEIAGAQIDERSLKVTPQPFLSRKIKLRQESVAKLLGIDLSIDEMVELLARLDVRAAIKHKDSIDLIVPSYRNDLHIEADLIEELARLYGYNKLPRRSCLYTGTSLTDAGIFKAENFVREKLLAEGLQEFITCDLISPKLAKAINEPTRKDIAALCVLHAKSQDYSVLRPSLLAGLLSSIKHNIDHQISSISCFEVGRVHFQEKQSIEERTHIAIALTGNQRPYHHNPRPGHVDFFDIKGILENLLHAIHAPKARYSASHMHTLQPGQQAIVSIEEQTVAFLGKVHPLVLQEFAIKQEVFYLEIDLHTLEKYIHTPTICTPLPIYPSSERDWTLNIAKEFPIAKLFEAIESQRSLLLASFSLLDIYENEKIGTDSKNVTWRFCYRSNEKTLSYEEVEKEHAAIQEKVQRLLHTT